MPYSSIFGAAIFVAVAIVAAPTYVASQPGTDKVEKDEAAAPDATPGSSGSWLTASDTDITRQVEGRLSKDARLKWVDVRTDRGAVILTGAVPNIGASTRASELARGVPGVRSVRNELAYEPGPMDDVGGPKTTSVAEGVSVNAASGRLRRASWQSPARSSCWRCIASLLAGP